MEYAELIQCRQGLLNLYFYSFLPFLLSSSPLFSLSCSTGGSPPCQTHALSSFIACISYHRCLFIVAVILDPVLSLHRCTEPLAPNILFLSLCLPSTYARTFMQTLDPILAPRHLEMCVKGQSPIWIVASVVSTAALPQSPSFLCAKVSLLFSTPIVAPPHPHPHPPTILFLSPPPPPFPLTPHCMVMYFSHPSPNSVDPNVSICPRDHEVSIGIICCRGAENFTPYK